MEDIIKQSKSRRIELVVADEDPAELRRQTDEAWQVYINHPIDVPYVQLFLHKFLIENNTEINIVFAYSVICNLKEIAKKRKSLYNLNQKSIIAW